jgi:hypothetical protein
MASDVPWRHPQARTSDDDAIIFHGGRGMDGPHLIKHICSRRVLDRAIARLAFLEGLPQNGLSALRSPPSIVEQARH